MTQTVVEQTSIVAHPMAGAWIAHTQFFYDGQEIDHFYALGALHQISSTDAKLTAARYRVQEKARMHFLAEVVLSTKCES